jgi:membrane protease YdiL (CAAX protease family)
MMILAALHTLFVTVLKMKSSAGIAIAIAISAVLFALYHFDPGRFAETFSWSHATFFFVAGVFFGVIYIFRGFGIVVATHAFYDIVTAFLQ